MNSNAVDIVLEAGEDLLTRALSFMKEELLLPEDPKNVKLLSCTPERASLLITFQNGEMKVAPSTKDLAFVLEREAEIDQDALDFLFYMP